LWLFRITQAVVKGRLPQDFIQYRSVMKASYRSNSMARVAFFGLDVKAASQLASVLTSDGHEIQRESPNVPFRDLLKADIVFVGGEREQYLSLLRRLRALDPTLPVVVVARLPETSEWLDALEAGATDYCVPPFDQRQIRSLIASPLANLPVSFLQGAMREPISKDRL
jgi:DNA-binding NtrC family response regulator